MYSDNFENMLPGDDELLRRENIFLDLFKRYSIDEGDNPKLADLDNSDKEDEADDNASGSSFSETSSVEEGDDANLSGATIDEIAEKLQPIIQERVNAWPEKGINFQLKRTDPSVGVEEWLKANQKSTTTTKKYKRTVVNEEKKTTITTTKHTTTTTNRSIFNSFHIPRLMATNHMPILSPIEECPDDIPATHAKSEDMKMKSKDAVVNKLPVRVELSKLPNVNRLKFQSPQNPPKKSDKEPRRERLADHSTQKKSKQSVKRQHSSLKPEDEPKSTQIESKSTKKISPPAVWPPVDENQRCLRPRLKRNAVLPVVHDEVRVVDKPKKALKTPVSRGDKTAVNKPPKIVETTAPKKSTTKKQDHPMDLTSTDLRPTARLPLKDIQTNLNLNVRVNLVRLPHCAVTTTRSARIRKSDDATDTWQLPSLGAPTADIYDSTTQPSRGRGRHRTAVMENKRRMTVSRPWISSRKNSIRNHPSQHPIVIYSPNSDTPLGSQIDDKMMLVTQQDFTKLIHPKHARNTSVFENTIIPINRRIVYQPPVDDTMTDTDNDSECEDVLLSSYMKTGRFEQINVET